MARRAALVGAAAAGIAGLLATIALAPEVTPLDRAWPLAWVGFPTVGALILLRRPRNTVGRLLLAVGMAISIAMVSQQAALRDVGAARQLSWLGEWTAVLGFGLIPFLLLVFPSGRIGPTWRWPVRLAAGALGGLTLWYAVRPESPGGGLPENVFGIEALAPVGPFVAYPLTFVLLVFAVAVVGASVRRLSTAAPIERLQMKWVVASAVVFVVLFALAIPVESISLTASNVLAVAAFVLGMNGIAAGIAIAVLRYRLYEIDRVISRTVGYGLVAGLLATTFAVTVTGLTAVLPTQSSLAVAASTLVVAGLFDPARRRIQAMVDRRFNRARFDAARVVAEFGSALRTAVAADGTTEHLRFAVNRTLQPSIAALWLAGLPSTRRRP